MCGPGGGAMGTLTYLVTGVSRAAGRAVASWLHHLGREVIGVDAWPVAAAPYRTHVVPATGPNRYVPALFELCRRHRVEVLVPTLASELTVMAAVRQTAQRSGVAIAIGDGLSVNVAVDRWLTFQCLRQMAVPVPYTLLASEVISAAQIRAHLELPVLRKPRSGHDPGAVTVHHDLRTVFSGIAEDRYVLQEFMPGAAYTASLYLSAGGAVHGSVLRTEPHTPAQRVPDADLMSLAVTAARAIGLQGAVEVQLRRRRDGTPAVCEVYPTYGTHCGSVPEAVEALVAEHEVHAVA